MKLFKTKEDSLTEASILYHTLGNSKIEITSLTFNQMFPKSTIRLNSGDIILGVNDTTYGGVRPDRPNSGPVAVDITNPTHPDYVAPDNTNTPTNTIFYIFK